MTILIAGGTGILGTRVARLLTDHGRVVRILTRGPARAQHLAGDHVEVVAGDVRDFATLARAMAGAETVISAIQGFSGTGGDNPRTVDGEGNANLIRAAREAGAGHFILVSVQGAAPDHPMDLFRMKYRAEQDLRASGLTWTIIRPTASMETWAKIVGEPLMKTGATQLFGRGVNPINFVSADDVARFVNLAVTDPAMRGEVVEVGGPENLSMAQFAQTFEAVNGEVGKVRHVPLPMMQLMAVLLRPVKPTIARQIQAGVVMDTRDMTFDASETGRRYPAVAQTSLAGMVRRDYGQAM
ncbi:MAG: SDR family oxidoreductase [Chloroflexota bacterium]|nr:SDR family oxidoreductase [Chloroflexota bacterium]MDQ6906931.1 SDR family oxidoreductase [Chloroflexota bacterium]